MGSVSAFIKKIEDDFFLGYSLLGQNTAKLLKEEAISRRDGVVDCYVVEITTSSHTVFTWWVDKKRSRGAGGLRSQWYRAAKNPDTPD
jgi:hypothetical protein